MCSYTAGGAGSIGRVTAVEGWKDLSAVSCVVLLVVAVHECTSYLCVDAEECCQGGVECNWEEQHIQSGAQGKGSIGGTYLCQCVI